MRQTRMTKLAFPIAALAAGALLAGCASSSTSSPSAAGASNQSTIPSGNPSAAGPSPASAPPPTSSPPATSAPAPTAMPPRTSAPARTSSAPGVSAQVPASATSATVSYVGPAGTKHLDVHKTVTGATLQRLTTDLNALKAETPGAAQCNVETGESSSVTVAAGGHTLVFLVNGSPCRGVRLTIDNTDHLLLAGSGTLVTQLRDIAGYTGIAKPLAN
jgi:hypothetical protein